MQEPMVDLGAYRDKFGESGQRVLENALGESRRRDQNYIAVAHIICALAKEEPDLFNSTMLASTSAKGFALLPTRPTSSSERWSARALMDEKRSKPPTSSMCSPTTT